MKLVPESDAVSSGAATGEHNVVGQDGGANVSGGNPSVPFKRSCIHQSSSTSCLGQQSHDDGHNVCGVGLSVPSKRPCIRQSSSISCLGEQIHKGLLTAGGRLTVVTYCHNHPMVIM
nr:hypothetical protein [Tanacetum cinerariifolium]